METVELMENNWVNALPMLIEIVRNSSTQKGRMYAEDELRKIARLADKYVDSLKEAKYN